MRRLLPWVITLTGLLSLSLSGLQAQTLGVREGQRVRVQGSTQTGIVVGNVTTIRSDSLVLAATSPEIRLTRVAVRDIRYLEVSRGRPSHWLLGAALGAASGFLVSRLAANPVTTGTIGIGGGVGELTRSTGALRLAPTTTVTSSRLKPDLIGTGAGLVVGTIIGTMTHHGEERWDTVRLPGRSSARLDVGPHGIGFVISLGGSY